ncbi:MAG: hypothetical protein IPK80_22820 [Nannocystis sp.]|nr:hypothetical protein [Nannocystis sp.]
MTKLRSPGLTCGIEALALLVCYLGVAPAAYASGVDVSLGSWISGAARGALHGCGLEVFSLQLWSPGLTAPELPCPGGSLIFDFGALALLCGVVIAAVRMRLRAEGRRMDLARRYLEQGREPPLALFPSAAEGDLRRGVILTAAGIGLLAAGALAGRGGEIGLVPGFVGLGYLVSFGLSRRISTRRRA